MLPSVQDDTALRRSFISVLGQDGFVGAAVLISDSLVLTCAHVVNTALGRDHFETSTPGPDKVVRLRMPHVDRDRELTGRIDHTMWRPPRPYASANSGASAAGRLPYFGDLAVLRLGEPVPDGAEPAPFLPQRDGYEVTALWASGNPLTALRALPRAVAEPWVVYDVAAGSLVGGFSGGPLWDREREAVVGVVVAAHVASSSERAASGAAVPLYAIGLPTIEAELPDLPPLAVPMAGHGRQQMLDVLEQLLPGSESVRKCEERLAAKLSREPEGQAADCYRLLALALSVRRGVPELLDVVRDHLADTDPVESPARRLLWDRLLHVARVVSEREILTAQQRRDLVGLLAYCHADPTDLLQSVLPYADEWPRVSGLVDVTDLLEGYDPAAARLMPPLLQAVVRIALTEGSAGNSVAQDLDAWVTRVARRLGVPEAAVDQFREAIRPAPRDSPSAVVGPRVQVELLPLAPGHRFTYQIWVWNGEGRHEVVLVQDSEVSSEQVVEGIRRVLRNEVQEHADQALVEFFVAPAWLRLDVDTWKLAGNEEDSAFLLGISRRVVLRSSSRTRETYAGWKRRTKALPSSQPLVLDHHSTDPTVAQARLEATPDAGVVIMCCEQQHHNRVLRQCLQAGVHTVLWHRQSHDTETAKRLLDLVQGIGHADLPETVRRERARALADPDCLTHHGRRLSLLYDGPDHRPPPLAPDAWALTQP
ncbi:serine protease [Streptomyces sp. A244]|uniref:VMAP-C domain-containing protein n=1 Tax=Streptomyces sp. A244 TaxID=2137016 RepID=UPI000D19BE33|nr:trypsin-like peptidase domain-containing protein [Streptomyces sp. A244]PTH83802.1 serine protease [Streptomyces sp. A244]